MMRSKKVLITMGAILIAAVLLIAVGAAKGGTKPQMVKTTTVTKGDLSSYLSTNAVVKSIHSKSYTGAAQFPVKNVNVKVGDQVKKGQVMLSYDIYDLETNVSQAKIQYNNALIQKNDLVKQRKQVNDTIANLDKQIKQLEAGMNPADALEVKTLKQKREAIQPISDEKLQLLDNSVSLSKLALDSANAKLEKYKDGIVAEFDGIVTALNATEGTALNPAQPAVTIQQLDNLKAVMSLGKYDALKIKTGQEAVLKNGEKLYKGVVSFINPAAAKSVSVNGQGANLEVEIDILDKNPDLKVDFDVNADILLGNAKDALKIPVECIKFDKSGASYVFVLDGEVAKQVEVKLGIQSDMEAQVLEGLSAGQSVILNPGIALKDGAYVKINEGGKK